VRQATGSDRENSHSGQEAEGDSKDHCQKDGSDRGVNHFLIV